MVIAVVFAILTLGLWLPETRIGGALRRLLIDQPARWLTKLRRGHVLLLLVLFDAPAALARRPPASPRRPGTSGPGFAWP